MAAAQYRLNAVGTDFICVRRRPKKGDSPTHRLIDPLTARPEGQIAIILQGPIDTTDDFTAETIKYYRLICPELTVIVSTWENEPEDRLRRCRDLGAVVVTSKQPEIAGRVNVNLQITSTLAGIKTAAALGCRYIAKSRTDMRLYSIHTILRYPQLLESIPPNGSSRQNARLIVPSEVTCAFAPYMLSDFFMFGRTEDIIDYWDSPLDHCVKSRTEIQSSAALSKTVDGMTELAPERYLVSNFITRSGGEAPYSLSAWWQTLQDRFIVIDVSSLELYWRKNQCDVDDWQSNHPFQSFANYAISNTDWQTLYYRTNLDESPPEDILMLDATVHPPIRFPPRENG